VQVAVALPGVAAEYIEVRTDSGSASSEAIFRRKRFMLNAPLRVQSSQSPEQPGFPVNRLKLPGRTLLPPRSQTLSVRKIPAVRV
jgi:hypothetical protein